MLWMAAGALVVVGAVDVYLSAHYAAKVPGEREDEGADEA